MFPLRLLRMKTRKKKQKLQIVICVTIAKKLLRKTGIVMSSLKLPDRVMVSPWLVAEEVLVFILDS